MNTAAHRQAQPAQPAPQPEAHYTRVARATATLQLVTPLGYPASLTVSAATPPEEIAALLIVAQQTAEQAAEAGWTAPATIEAEPAHAATAGSEPTFCGYVCSRTYDDTTGAPAWIIVDGRQAHRREKQGDQWYSYRDDAGSYSHVLTIRKGEKAPAIVWPAGQEPQRK